MLQKSLSGVSLALIFATFSLHAQEVATSDASAASSSDSASYGEVEVSTSEAAVETNSFFLPGGYGYLPEVITPGAGLYGRPPIEVFLNVEQGYNDNIYSSSGEPFAPPKKGSATTQATVGLNYLLNASRTFLSLGADAGAMYYWDREGDSFSPVGNLNAVFSHRATDRLSFNVRMNGGYYSQPDVWNSYNVRSNTGDYFVFNALVDTSYRWTQLFSTVTTVGGRTTLYRESYADYSNNLGYFVGQQFRYLFTPRFTGVLDLRFDQSFYYNDKDRDSTTETALLGFDWLMSPRLTSTLRAGVSFRQYELPGASDQASPFVETGVGYRYGQGSLLQWTGRYGFEDGDWSYQRTQALRTGLSVSQVFTPRISASLGVYYVYEFREQMLANQAPVDDLQLVDVSARLNYVINRSITVYGGYGHTQAISDDSYAEYKRNIYTLGVTYRF